MVSRPDWRAGCRPAAFTPLSDVTDRSTLAAEGEFWDDESMTWLSRFALVAAGVSAGLGISLSSGLAATVQLAPHRAVYDLKMIRADEGAGLKSLDGRLVLELLGSVCEGYSLNSRYVFRSVGEAGDSVVSDVRMAQWEDGEFEQFRFVSRRYDNEQLSERTDGVAVRKDGSSVEVTLEQPGEATVMLDGPVLFPTQHLTRMIETADAGDRFLTARLFDGSETGDKVLSTLAVIGEVVPGGGDRSPADDELADLDPWRVTVSYFEESYTPGDIGPGEQLPIYTITFDLFQNGVSGNLVLDYGTFELSGELREIEFFSLTDCGN